MKKWIIFVIVLCFGIGKLSSNEQIDKYDFPIIDGFWEQVNIYMDLYSGVSYSNTLTNNSLNNIAGRYSTVWGFSLNRHKYKSKSIINDINIGFEFNNLGYSYVSQMENEIVNNKVELSYITLPISYTFGSNSIFQNYLSPRSYFSDKYVNHYKNFCYFLVGAKLSYLYDIELYKNEITNYNFNHNFNKFDLNVSFGLKYIDAIQSFIYFIEPSINFSLINHNKELNKSNQFFNSALIIKFGTEFEVFDGGYIPCPSAME